jgi:hypothetical protein
MLQPAHFPQLLKIEIQLKYYHVSRNIVLQGGHSHLTKPRSEKKNGSKLFSFFGGGTEVPLDLFNSRKSFPNSTQLRPRFNPTSFFFLADVQLDNLFPERALKLEIETLLSSSSFPVHWPYH